MERMKDDSKDYSVKAIAPLAPRAIEILEAAEIRIRRGGFEAVSYRDLATDVGIKAASVHYHFPQKALLGAAVVDRYSDKLSAALGSVDLTKATVEEHLQRLCDCYVGAVKNDGMICLGCMLGAESKVLPDAVAVAARRFFTRLLDWIRSALGDHADAATLAVHIIGALQGTMILAVTLQRPELMDEAAAQLKRLVTG
jgi:TetR/AcrR family transcriptional regulator, transcriptional repressor for nem operon